MLPPKEQTFYAPNEPFVRGDIWIVEVAVRSSNPIHRAIYHVGFIDERQPATSVLHFGGYNAVWSNSADVRSVVSLHYFKPLRKIGNLKG